MIIFVKNIFMISKEEFERAQNIVTEYKIQEMDRKFLENTRYFVLSMDYQRAKKQASRLCTSRIPRKKGKRERRN